MNSLDDAAAAAADFYDRHYAPARSIFLERGTKKRWLGCSTKPRHCRFCNGDEPNVTFKHEAHALPAAFGNTGLFSNYECDDCNHLFGEGIEDHLGRWTKPMRTISRIKGRRGVPTIKKHGAEKGWRIEYEETSFKLQEYEDDPKFEVDEEAKQLRFELHRDTYIPVAVLKGLVKIGLTLIRDSELQHFRETFEWIRQTDHSRRFVAEFPIIRTFVPGPMRSDLIVLMLMRRHQSIDTVPYAFFTMAYGNEVLQVFLPSVSQDRCINGKNLTLPPFPNPGSADPALFGKPKVTQVDLAGREAIEGDSMPVTMSFDSAVRAKVDIPNGSEDPGM